MTGRVRSFLDTHSCRTDIRIEKNIAKLKAAEAFKHVPSRETLSSMLSRERHIREIGPRAESLYTRGVSLRTTHPDLPPSPPVRAIALSSDATDSPSLGVQPALPPHAELQPGRRPTRARAFAAYRPDAELSSMLSPPSSRSC